MSNQFRVPVLENFAWQQPVISKTLSVPPSTPAKGDRYIIAATASGAWLGHDKAIAWFDGTIWRFDAPAAGWNAYNNADSKEYQYNGTAWVTADVIGKADKVSGATNDDIATLDATGNLKDSGITKTAVQGAITNSHTQGTDQFIDQGGANQSTAAQIKTAVTKTHTQNTDQFVDFGGANQTTAAQIKTASTNTHVQGTDQSLDQGGANQVSAAQAKQAYTSRAVYDVALGVMVFTNTDTQ